MGASDFLRADNRCATQRLASENGIAVHDRAYLSLREARKGEELHRELSRTPNHDARGVCQLCDQVTVDPLHLLSGMPNVGGKCRRQLLIAQDRVVVGSTAGIAEEAEHGRVERVFRCLHHFLLDYDRLETEAASRVLECSPRKMVDVFGIKFLEGRVEIVVVTGGVGSLKIQIASRGEKTTSGCEKSRNVVNMFEHMAEDHAVKFRHVRGSSSNRAYIGFKAAIAARGGAARRGIESGDTRKSLIAEGREQAARGAAGIEDAGSA